MRTLAARYPKLTEVVKLSLAAAAGSYLGTPAKDAALTLLTALFGA